MPQAATSAAAAESAAPSGLPSHSNGSASRGGRRQRAQRRVAHRVPCRVRIDGRIPATVVGQTVNLSAGGLSIQLSRDIPIGARVEVLVPASNDAFLQITGSIVHSRRVMTGGYELGIVRDCTVPGEPPVASGIGFRPATAPLTGHDGSAAV